MSNWSRKVQVITALVFFCLVGIVVFASPQKTESEAITLLSKQIPEFAVGMLTIPEATASNWDFRGQLSLFNVFNSSCKECQEERAIFMKIADAGEYQLIGLSLFDTRDSAIAGLDKYGNPFSRIAFDDDGEVARSLAVASAPVTFVVDHNERIRYKHVGPVTEAIWQDTIRPILRQVARERE